MSSPLRTFIGFKGKVAFAQIMDFKFAIVCHSDRELRSLWAEIMPSVPLDPRGIKSAILIESNNLPSQVGRVSPSAPAHEDNLDRLNAGLGGGPFTPINV